MTHTLEDIARISGFSRSTVSRVVNDKDGVSKKTREIVLKKIEEVGFQPNMAARGLAAGKSNIIGLFVPKEVNSFFTDPFFPLLMQGVSHTCNARNYSLLLSMESPDHESLNINKILSSGLVSGLIVSSTRINDPILPELKKSNIPFMIVGASYEDEALHFVDVDNISGAGLAVIHFAALGRKRIGIINGPLDMMVGHDRFLGYQNVLHQLGFLFETELVATGDFTISGGYRAMQALLPQQPDAVFAASDAMAVGAMQAIKDANLRVPEDIAIIGYDDIPMAEEVRPKLTTIRQPIIQLGETAANLMINLIDKPDEIPGKTIFQPELVIRESCGAKII